MGGAAFLLEGDVDPALLADRPLPRSLLDRLLFRTRHRSVTRTSWGEDTQLDIPLPPELNKMWPAFKNWLSTTLPDGDPAASAVMSEYAQVDIFNAYLRGVEHDGKTRYYVQLTFSGCAGLGEVSAQLFAHWAELWWTRDRTAVEALCVPHGFKPSGPWDEPGVAAAPLFFPLKLGGYVQYTDAQALPPAPGLPPPEGLPWLEVDGALYEQREDVDERLAALKPIAEEVFADRRCRCAMCDPEFRRQDGCAL